LPCYRLCQRLAADHDGIRYSKAPAFRYRLRRVGPGKHHEPEPGPKLLIVMLNVRVSPAVNTIGVELLLRPARTDPLNPPCSSCCTAAKHPALCARASCMPAMLISAAPIKPAVRLADRHGCPPTGARMFRYPHNVASIPFHEHRLCCMRDTCGAIRWWPTRWRPASWWRLALRLLSGPHVRASRLKAIDASRRGCRLSDGGMFSSLVLSIHVRRERDFLVSAKQSPRNSAKTSTR